MHQLVLTQQPRVKLLELRLPGGGVRGGKVPLGLLWDRGQTLNTYPLQADGTSSTTYDRAALSATLRPILSQATEIYTLNPDTVAFMEHPDHILAARITRVVAQSLKRDVPIGYHVTYPTGGLPKNLDAAQTLRKRDVVGSYFAIDGNDAGHVFGSTCGTATGSRAATGAWPMRTTPVRSSSCARSSSSTNTRAAA